MKKHLYLEAIASVVTSYVQVTYPENAVYQYKGILSTNVWVSKNTSGTWTAEQQYTAANILRQLLDTFM